MRYQVGVGQEHSRSIDVGAEDAHGFAGLHQQCLVVLQHAQRLENEVEAAPVPCGTTDPSVNHEILRSLGHVRIEIVLQHSVGGFSEPVLAGQCGTVRRPYRARPRLGHGKRIHGCFLQEVLKSPALKAPTKRNLPAG